MCDDDNKSVVALDKNASEVKFKTAEYEAVEEEEEPFRWFSSFTVQKRTVLSCRTSHRPPPLQPQVLIIISSTEMVPVVFCKDDDDDESKFFVNSEIETFTNSFRQTASKIKMLPLFSAGTEARINSDGFRNKEKEMNF